MELVAAKRSDAPTLDALLQEYLHEFSAFEDIPIGADGRYAYPYLAHYWTEPDRHSYLILVDDDVAGLALARVDKNPDDGTEVMDMAEFFVVPAHRRKGIGETAARRLWALFPGPWQVRVLLANEPALAFWRQVVGSYTGDQYSQQYGEGALADSIAFSFVAL